MIFRFNYLIADIEQIKIAEFELNWGISPTKAPMISQISFSMGIIHPYMPSYAFLNVNNPKERRYALGTESKDSEGMEVK